VLVEAVCCAEVAAEKNNDTIHKKSATFCMVSLP